MFKAIYQVLVTAAATLRKGVQEIFDNETVVGTTMTMEATRKVVSVFVFAIGCISYFLPGLRPWTNSLMQVGMGLWNHHSESRDHALDARQA